MVALPGEQPSRRDGRRELRDAARRDRENGAAPREEEVAELVDPERDAGEEVAAKGIGEAAEPRPGEVEDERRAPEPGTAGRPGAGIVEEFSCGAGPLSPRPSVLRSQSFFRCQFSSRVSGIGVR